jgi:RNA polymerase sigma-70 factor, ECF subfamily
VTAKIQIASPDYWKLSDEELIRHFRELNEYTYIKYIFQRYGHIVFGICLKQVKDVATAKTLMEDTFIKLMTAIKQQPIHDFKPWLFKYLHADDKIIEGGNTTYLHENETWLPGKNEDNIDNDISYEKVESILSQLPPEQRLCLKLFYQENKTCAAIAKETGYTTAQIKTWLYSGRKNIASDPQLHMQTH